MHRRGDHGRIVWARALGVCFAWATSACTIVTTEPAPTAPASPIACGTYPGAACPTGAYCHFEPEDRCGETGVMGACRPVPAACTAVEAPVCGCDRQSHRNACEAGRAGTSVLASGTCEATSAPGGPATSCGGSQGIVCPEGQFCQLEACRPDAGGACRPRPQTCTQAQAPVCGCDGRTYMNDCAANAYGISVSYGGPCAPPPTPSQPPIL